MCERVTPLALCDGTFVAVREAASRWALGTLETDVLQIHTRHRFHPRNGTEAEQGLE